MKKKKLFAISLFVMALLFTGAISVSAYSLTTELKLG